MFSVFLIIMKTMKILGKIFGSPGRVRVMRLFILNKEEAYERKDIAKISRLSPASVGKEIRMLSTVGFIKKKGTSKWVFNPKFKYVHEFETVLAGENIFSPKIIQDNLKGIGAVKLMIASGFFSNNKEGQLDILIVGNKLKKPKIQEGIRKIEADLGKELLYAVFDTKEFVYRLGMYDKLVRDVLDFPHKVIVESKELSTQSLKRA